MIYWNWSTYGQEIGEKAELQIHDIMCCMYNQ